jgi:hypothetical protein
LRLGATRDDSCRRRSLGAFPAVALVGPLVGVEIEQRKR